MQPPQLIDKHRLEALADGVYAIALTLLVLELKLPALGTASNEALVQALLALLPKALVWLLSFWVMTVFWLGQQRALRMYEVLDHRAMQVELVQLACISLLPFSTSLMGEHGDLAASAFIYALHLAALAFLSLLRVQRVARHLPLRSAAFDAWLVRQHVVRARITLACALLATALAYWLPGWNMLAMLLLLPLNRMAMKLVSPHDDGNT